MRDTRVTNIEYRGVLAWLVNARMPQLVQNMRRDAVNEYQTLLRDLDAPMEPAFEREVARTLNRGGNYDLIPAETLMPMMMERFGLTPEDFSDQEANLLSELTMVCNKCPAVGRCWKAIRADAGWEKCRGFCPNTDAFELKSLSITD